MYTSDEFTLLAIFFVITILNAVSMIFVWRLHFREDATRLWATSNLFAAASAFAYLLRPSIPETLSVLSGYLAGVAGIFIFACGIARFFRRPAPWRLGIFVTLGVFIAAAGEEGEGEQNDSDKPAGNHGHSSKLPEKLPEMAGVGKPISWVSV
jgi:hypothetical protein